MTRTRTPEEIRELARTVVGLTALEFRAFTDALDDLGRGGDGDGSAGVREPRRPRPPSRTGAAILDRLEESRRTP